MHGHAAGDLLLQAMAGFLSQFFRAGDRVIRVGGDEFLVLLPATGADEAERIRSRLPSALHAVQCRAGHGPALLHRHERDCRRRRLGAGLKRADERLYEAKRVAITGQL